jgi:hypothetical protein
LQIISNSIMGTQTTSSLHRHGSALQRAWGGCRPAARLSITCAALLAATAAGSQPLAQTPPQPPMEVQTQTRLPDCPVAPFGDPTAEQRATMLDGKCSFDSTRWKVETPRARPVDPRPSQVRAQYSSLTSLKYSSSLQGSLKFDWSTFRGGDERSSLRTDRAVFALGGMYQIDDSLAVQTNVGMEQAGEARTRATVSSLWRPFKSSFLFAEWAGSNAGTEAHRLGGRVWVVPRRLAIDLGARYLPDGPGWVDRRIGLALNLEL